MAFKRIFKQDEFRELGFGNKVLENDQRLMNKDGSSNVRRSGLSFLQRLNFYHSLITMPWWKFNIVIFGSYITVNFLFAIAYYLFTPDGIAGMIFTTEAERFLEIFYFSAQSLTTVGYGRLNPTGPAASTLAGIESMIGLLGFALATGLLYGRFSRPVVRLLYSHNAIVAPYREMTGLMMRVANKYKSELIDITAELMMGYIDTTDGKSIRRFKSLKLELTRVNLLSTSWTIVHPIDEESPLNGWKEKDFTDKKVELLLFILAYEETFATTVHSRTSYSFNEIRVGRKFIPMVQPGPDGSVLLQLDKLDETETVELPIAD